MDSETTEHVCASCSVPDCKLCEQERKKCLARRTEKYLQDFNEWSKEDIEKMEEKFEEFKRATAGWTPCFHSRDRPVTVRFDNNLKEREYWIKRYQNDYEKEMHKDPDSDSTMGFEIFTYLSGANRDFGLGRPTCNCLKRGLKYRS